MEYILTFLEGLASFVSPCVLPMVPMYLAYFAGKDDNAIKKTLINSFTFVLGFTTVFTLMSVLASTIGIFIHGNVFYFKMFFSAILILFGLHYMDVIRIKELDKASGINMENNNFGFFTSFLFGILFSITWTPCVGVFLSSALLLATKSASILKGMVLVLTYCLGLGIPFIIFAILIEKAKSIFDVIKKHYKIVKIVSGLMLIFTGIYILF